MNEYAWTLTQRIERLDLEECNYLLNNFEEFLTFSQFTEIDQRRDHLELEE